MNNSTRYTLPLRDERCKEARDTAARARVTLRAKHRSLLQEPERMQP